VNWFTVKKCIFVAAGDVSDRYFDACMKLNPRPYVYAIDAGYAYLEKRGTVPDCVIGDFDSLGYVPRSENLRIFPSRKDKSDMMLAADIAKTEGFELAYVLGGFGGERPDHSVANIQHIFYAGKDLRLIYLDERTFCFGLFDETAKISNKGILIRGSNTEDEWENVADSSLSELADPLGSYLSVFTQDKAIIDLSGTAYDGMGYEISGSFPLGLSNEITTDSGLVRAYGNVFVMLSGTTGKTVGRKWN